MYCLIVFCPASAFYDRLPLFQCRKPVPEKPLQLQQPHSVTYVPFIGFFRNPHTLFRQVDFTRIIHENIAFLLQRLQGHADSRPRNADCPCNIRPVHVLIFGKDIDCFQIILHRFFLFQACTSFPALLSRKQPLFLIRRPVHAHYIIPCLRNDFAKRRSGYLPRFLSLCANWSLSLPERRCAPPR